MTEDINDVSMTYTSMKCIEVNRPYSKCFTASDRTLSLVLILILSSRHYIYNVYCSFIYVFLPLIYDLILLFLFLSLKRTEFGRNVHLIAYNFKC